MVFSLFGGGNQSDSVKEAARIQARASKRAAELQFRAFEQIRADFAPFLGLGTDASNFLRGLFFGTGPSAGLFFEPGTQRTVSETVANPEIAALQRRIAGLPATIRQRNPNLPQVGQSRLDEQGGRFGPQFINVANPEIARLRGQLNALAPTVTRSRTVGERGPRRDFGEIVKAFDPTFGFRQSEGERAISRNLAARGLSASGPAGRALTEFNENLALGSAENFLNRLASFAGFGQTSAANLGQFNLGSAGAAGNFLQNAGAARASGLIGAGNIQAQQDANLERLLFQIGGFGGGLALGRFF